jgi:hypothetical protein
VLKDHEAVHGATPVLEGGCASSAGQADEAEKTGRSHGRINSTKLRERQSRTGRAPLSRRDRCRAVAGALRVG